MDEKRAKRLAAKRLGWQSKRLAYLSMKGWAKRDSSAGILTRLMLLAMLTAVLALLLIGSIPFLLKLAA